MTANNNFVLVTGAAKRLGRVIALHLAEAGWNIAVHYNTSRAEAEETAKAIRAMGRKADIVQADLANHDAVGGLIPSLIAAGYSLTALVNNASLFDRDDSDPDGSRHNAVNFEAPVKLINCLVKNLPAGTTGAVVNILDATPIPDFMNAYRTSRVRLFQMSRVMALSLAPRVRINAVAPGPVMKSPRQSDAHFAKLVAAAPLGIATPPEAVASTVRFLLENPAITGEVLRVDCGTHLNESIS